MIIKPRSVQVVVVGLVPFVLCVFFVRAAPTVVPAGSVPAELAESKGNPFTPLASQAIVTNESRLHVPFFARTFFIWWGHPLDVVVDHRGLAYRVVGGFFKQARPNIGRGITSACGVLSLRLGLVLRDAILCPSDVTLCQRCTCAMHRTLQTYRKHSCTRDSLVFRCELTLHRALGWKTSPARGRRRAPMPSGRRPRGANVVEREAPDDAFDKLQQGNATIMFRKSCTAGMCSGQVSPVAGVLPP